MNIKDIKNSFPIFKKKVNGKKLVYLDSANSSQKPQTVIDSLSKFYSEDFANVGRGIYTLAANASEQYESTRKELKKFINASDQSEIIFTKNSTESLNLVANCFGTKFINEGDEIISTELEHHANYVPWHFLRKKKGAIIKFIPIDEKGNLKLHEIEKLITDRTKIISLTHMSNVTGTIVDIKKVVEIAKKRQIPVCVDGTQGAAHLDLNLKDLDCDFYAFSGHKMYGPTGVGILNIKYKWIDVFEPYIGGGGMIDNVSKDNVDYAKGAWKFEAGTMPTAEIIALNKSIEFINSIGKKNIIEHETDLTTKALKELKSIDTIELVGDPTNRGGVFSFNIKDIHSHDVSTIFDSEGIAVRGGHHCCQILHDKLNLNSSVRVSFGVYNDENDINILLKGIEKCQSIFKK
ncbi:MAG: cysteine desulfurase [Candidatus Pelagibacter sp.]|nr:cysteine desulfurase [Candidatus Pelagibacter sp.]OUV97850.1 MAG: cysteine desulfurase [Candidatus Pelagibacter sp. TMED142]|tara:strand:- start:741 stop:1958 length:1218 start_codon:yes stop_codon:yes gene_type:complete